MTSSTNRMINLCGGGDVCLTGDLHCCGPCLVAKDPAQGFVRGNIAWVSCVASNYLSRGNAYTEKKPGRNDLCYCGSGKKVKNCVMKDQKVIFPPGFEPT